MEDYAFQPDPERAGFLYQRMQEQLASSLAYLLEELGPRQPPGSLLPETLGHALETLAVSSRVSPLLFGAYYQLVQQAFEDQHDLDEPLRAMSLVLDEPAAQDILVFRSLDEMVLGEVFTRLYCSGLDTDPRVPARFLPPDEEQADAMRRCILDALALMERGAPALAGEFRQLVTEVVFAASPADGGAFRFDGASSYMLWGSLFLNVEEPKSVLEMIEALAHESGHSFLFGMTIDEPLVYNSDDELFSSPLRADPRPMDGIYHATFVSARMQYAMREMRASELLSDAQLAECDGYLAASERAFWDGHQVVEQLGQLSASGQALMDAAKAYM